MHSPQLRGNWGLRVVVESAAYSIIYIEPLFHIVLTHTIGMKQLLTCV